MSLQQFELWRSDTSSQTERARCGVSGQSQCKLFFFFFLAQKTETFCCVSTSGASKTCTRASCLTNQGSSNDTWMTPPPSTYLQTLPSELRASSLATARNNSVATITSRPDCTAIAVKWIQVDRTRNFAEPPGTQQVQAGAAAVL